MTHISGGPTVVALGGGHGLAGSLSALRLVTDQITAVVTVADDGGSSGRLREEFGVLPPGDLRMALSALCDDSEWGRTWSRVLQHRFSSSGPLNGHALGNLLILSLWEELGGSVPALEWVGELLRIRGRVLPMSQIPLAIEADVEEEGIHRVIHGQVAVAKSRGHVTHVALSPEDPPIGDAVREAIDEADWVIMGPGSWFTSVIPHLLVPDLREALVHTSARKVLALNLATEGETVGMSASDHISSFHAHAPELGLDVILADPTSVDDFELTRVEAERCGARLVQRHVRMADGTPRHDSLRLAAAYRDIFEGL